MKRHILLLVFFGVISPAIRSQSPLPPRLEPVSAGWPFLFRVPTEGSSANVLLFSEDLKTWKHYRSILSRVPVFGYVNDYSLPGKMRFYRVRSRDAISHRVLLQQWQSLGFSNYEFKFQRTCFCGPGILSGIVTVKDGKVIAGRDTQGDGATIRESGPNAVQLD